MGAVEAQGRRGANTGPWGVPLPTPTTPYTFRVGLATKYKKNGEQRKMNGEEGVGAVGAQGRRGDNTGPWGVPLPAPTTSYTLH